VKKKLSSVTATEASGKPPGSSGAGYPISVLVAAVTVLSADTHPYLHLMP
jgi:hypothetical protein